MKKQIYKKQLHADFPEVWYGEASNFAIDVGNTYEDSFRYFCFDKMNHYVGFIRINWDNNKYKLVFRSHDLSAAMKLTSPYPWHLEIYYDDIETIFKEIDEKMK